MKALKKESAAQASAGEGTVALKKDIGELKEKLEKK